MDTPKDTPKVPTKRPRGRPVGAKGKKTILAEHIREKAVDKMMDALCEIVSVVADKAREGDLTAAKMILDRAIPVRKAEDGAASDKPMGGINIIINSLEAPSKGKVIDVQVQEIEH